MNIDMLTWRCWCRRYTGAWRRSNVARGVKYHRRDVVDVPEVLCEEDIRIGCVGRRGYPDNLRRVHLARHSNREHCDSLLMRLLRFRYGALGPDYRHSVGDNDGDIGHPGPVSVRGRELHRTHLTDTAGDVRALAVVRDSRDGLRQVVFVVVRVQVDPADDVGGISHDAHPSIVRPNRTHGHDLIDECQQLLPVTEVGIVYAS